MQIYTAKERQEVLVFYMRPEVQAIYSEYADQLSASYIALVGAEDSYDRDSKRMDLPTYLSVFGEIESGLVPHVLPGHDLELLFDTLVNERVDTGSESALTGSSLNFEEWKKSMVRIASLCTAKAVRDQMDSGEK